MKPSYAVTKKARKSSRYFNEHRHVGVPNRYLSTGRSYFNSNYGGPFAGILAGIMMMNLLRHRASRHAKGYIPPKVDRKGKI